MEDLFHALFFNDDEDDDVDQLFLALEQVVPPSALVDTILASVAHLPRPDCLSDADDTRKEWTEFGTLIVPTSHLQPS
jgi:hypothetical protein